MTALATGSPSFSRVDVIRPPYHRSLVQRDHGYARVQAADGSIQNVRNFKQYALITRYTGFCEAPWESLSRDDQLELVQVFRLIHGARLAVERLPRDHRWLAKETLNVSVWPDEIGQVPDFIYDVIRMTTP